MTLEDQTKTDVDRRIDCLREDYGDFLVSDETVENDLQFFEQGRELAAEGWRGDAGAWVEEEAGRALLIRHADAPDRWGVPGGGHEPGEHHAETARREVREETGIDVEITGVWRARRKEIVLATDPDRRFWMLTVWFEARPRDASGDELSVADDEVLEARWVADPPDAVLDFLEPKVREWADE
jgi:ADP-ribose pyrophosphatase YjhB (NUDIX family)